MRVRATTCLGDNTVGILHSIVERLREDGLDIEFDRSLEPGEREAAFRSGVVDVVWACGLLTAEQIAAGASWEVVAAPVFDGESGANYRSVVICRTESGFESIADSLSGRLAVNEYGSWSGYRGLARWLAGLGFTIDAYPTQVLTGSHRRSVAAVSEGVADIAAIDHTVWADLSESSDSSVDGLEVLTYTDDWPAPPFSVRSGADRDLVERLIAVEVPGLAGVVPTTVDTYLPMLSPQPPKLR